MSLLDVINDPQCWEAFYAYRTGLLRGSTQEQALRDYIDRRDYAAVWERISRGEPFPLPRRAAISKLQAGKKRIVYTYPEPENTALKLLTWQLLRRYDGLFAAELYSFRPNRNAKTAIHQLTSEPQIRQMYAYKADVSNYFNSVEPERFLPLLCRTLRDDPALYRFLSALLTEPRVKSGTGVIEERKGIMAGTPQSAFFANLYLSDVDARFHDAGVLYARYSDDIILFAPTAEETAAHAETLRAMLRGKGLELNPEKEVFTTPEEGWSFLGFRYREGRIDIAAVTQRKLKAKMRRKTRSLARWRDRNGKSGEQAAKAFIRIFNRKLLECPRDSTLSWAYWFFPVITTAESLAEIDRYAQDCLRVLISGTRTKRRFNVRYETLKKLGYRSLVHAYYSEIGRGQDAADKQRSEDIKE